jgi:acyl-CoA synthetase (AMP-forming)/AMP-acid ligase II
MNSPATLYGHLKTWAETDPQRTALIDPLPTGAASEGTESGHVRISVSDLLARTNEFADLLAEHGVGPNDCVAVWLPSWSDTYAWQFAASALGAHVIGVNTRYNVAEVGHVLAKARHAGARHGSWVPQPRLPRYRAEGHRRGGPGNCRTAGTFTGAAVHPAEGIRLGGAGSRERTHRSLTTTSAPGRCSSPLSRHPRGPSSRHCDRAPRSGSSYVEAASEGSRHSVAFTTSGSTGMPKLAAHRESAVISHSQQVASRIGFTTGDVLVEPLPYSGVFGYSAGMGALFGGAAVLLHPVFDEQELVRAWSTFSGSHFVGADDMLSRVRKVCEDTGTKLESWRWAGVADFQGMSADIAEWAAERFGTRTVGVYGSSEVFALTSFWPDDTPEELRYSGGGRLVDPRYEYRIADPVTDQPVSEGSEGEVQLRGPNVVDHYLGDQGEGRKNFTSDGWFQTGDLGRAQGPDAFEYVCRMGDVIRLRGFLVDPAEIELHLITHPEIELVKVVGRNSDVGEPEVVAFVQAVPGTTPEPEDIRQYCRQQLASFKVPTEVRLVETMPVTAGTNGSKIRTAVLREWAAQPAVVGQ